MFLHQKSCLHSLLYYILAKFTVHRSFLASTTSTLLIHLKKFSIFFHTPQAEIAFAWVRKLTVARFSVIVVRRCSEQDYVQVNL